MHRYDWPPGPPWWAIDAFQTTVSGVDGDSLLGDLPTIVSDLERIDTAWTALEGQIEQTCG